MASPAFLQQLDHRPYPPPATRWAMRQTWYHLLFAHWRVDVEALRRLVPAELELDLFEGEVWVGVVPFGMKDVVPRGLVALPWISKFLELNLRTYVVHQGRPGVWFFSLDAANRLAVEIARSWFKLPYFKARMQLTPEAEWIRYESRRTDGRGAPARLHARYRPEGAVFHAAPGSLESFLTDRFCLYVVDRGRVLRGEIHHGPWPLQRASAELPTHSMAEAAGIALPAVSPHLLYVREIEMVAWSPRDASTK